MPVPVHPPCPADGDQRHARGGAKDRDEHVHVGVGRERCRGDQGDADEGDWSHGRHSITDALPPALLFLSALVTRRRLYLTSPKRGRAGMRVT